MDDGEFWEKGALLTREHRSMLAVTSLSAYICFLHNIRATSLSNFTFIHSNTHTLTLALFFFFFLFKSVHFSRIIYEKWTQYKYQCYSLNPFNHTINISSLLFCIFSHRCRLLTTDIQPTSEERRPALLIQFFWFKE